MEELLKNIIRVRKAKGISQEAVAHDLGIDYSTYGKIERGKIVLTVSRLEKIAEILQVQVGDIYKPVHRQYGNEEEVRVITLTQAQKFFRPLGILIKSDQ